MFICQLLFSSHARRRGLEIFGEMRDRAHHRVRREAAQRAQRTELHRVAEVGDQSEVLFRLDAGGEPVDGLDATRRADAAWRALAAAFDGAEFHGKARM